MHCFPRKVVGVTELENSVGQTYAKGEGQQSGHSEGMTVSKMKRVIFNFDERSLESLQKMTEQGRYPSMASAVKDSLQISHALQSQAAQGFTELIVRNPETNEERVIVIPSLSPSSRSK